MGKTFLTQNPGAIKRDDRFTFLRIKYIPMAKIQQAKSSDE